MRTYYVLGWVKRDPYSAGEFEGLIAHADKVTKAQLIQWRNKFRSKYYEATIIQWQEIEDETQTDV